MRYACLFLCALSLGYVLGSPSRRSVKEANLKAPPVPSSIIISQPEIDGYRPKLRLVPVCVNDKSAVDLPSDQWRILVLYEGRSYSIDAKLEN